MPAPAEFECYLYDERHHLQRDRNVECAKSNIPAISKPTELLRICVDNSGQMGSQFPGTTSSLSMRSATNNSDFLPGEVATVVVRAVYRWPAGGNVIIKAQDFDIDNCPPAAGTATYTPTSPPGGNADPDPGSNASNAGHHNGYL